MHQQYSLTAERERQIAFDRFKRIHYNKFRDAQAYVDELEAAQQLIIDCDSTCRDSIMISKLLRGIDGVPRFKDFLRHYTLNEQFDPTLQDWDSVRTSFLTWDDIEGKQSVFRRHEKPTRPSNDKAPNDKPNVTCHECGIKGHYARDCRKRNGPASSLATTVRTTKAVVTSKKPFSHKKVVSIALANAERVTLQTDEQTKTSGSGRRQILGSSSPPLYLPSNADTFTSLEASVDGNKRVRMLTQPVSLLRSTDSSCIASSCSVQKTVRDNPHSSWIVDSGSNLHIVNDRKWFSLYTKMPQDVGTADGLGSLHMEGGGTVTLLLDTQDGIVDLTLRSVAYAPTSRCNILSMSLLSKRAGLLGQWGENRICIIEKNGCKVGHANLIDGLFHLSLAKPTDPSIPKHAVTMPCGVRPPYVVALVDYTNPV